jgi:hypothetical protein
MGPNGCSRSRSTARVHSATVKVNVFGGAPFVERAFNRLQIFQVGGLDATNANHPPRVDLPRDEIPGVALEGGANRLGHGSLPFGRDFRNGGHARLLHYYLAVRNFSLQGAVSRSVAVGQLGLVASLR